MIRQTTPNSGSPIPNATRIHTPQSGQLKPDSKITANAHSPSNPTATASTPAFASQPSPSLVTSTQSLSSRENSLVRPRELNFFSGSDSDSDLSGDEHSSIPLEDFQPSSFFNNSENKEQTHQPAVSIDVNLDHRRTFLGHGLNALDDSYSSSISRNSESKEQIHPHEVRIDINLVGDVPVPGQVIDPPNAPPNQIQNPIAEPHSAVLPSTLLGAAVVGTVIAAVSSPEHLPTLIVQTSVGAIVGGFAGAGIGCIIDSKMDREAQRIQPLQDAPDLEAGEA